MNYNLLKFSVHGDNEGNLVALEENKDIPFDIKRVYYIYGTSRNTVRGKHSHINLEQVIICINGSCDFILDDGNERLKIHLDSPNEGLHIKGKIWREFTNFSSDCVVMVLASEYYDPFDYIRDYNDFIRSTNKC